MARDSFRARSELTVNGTSHEIFRISAVEGSQRLPYSHKVLPRTSADLGWRERHRRSDSCPRQLGREVHPPRRSSSRQHA